MTVIAVLLTFASGASDVTRFTRLGNVFTSATTGNITVFGLSLARGSASLALHTAVAVAGDVAGVAAGTLMGRYRMDRILAKSPAEPAWRALARAHDADASGRAHAARWCPGRREATGSRPAGWAQYVILAVAACAMGIQSAAVVQLGSATCPPPISPGR